MTTIRISAISPISYHTIFTQRLDQSNTNLETDLSNLGLDIIQITVTLNHWRQDLSVSFCMNELNTSQNVLQKLTDHGIINLNVPFKLHFKKLLF